MYKRQNTVSPTFQQRLNKCLDHKLVGHTRGVGLIGAMEFVSQQDSNKPFQQKGKVGKLFMDLAKKEGLIVRAIGDIIAFCPPLIISDEQINDMFDIVDNVLDQTFKHSETQRLMQ